MLSVISVRRGCQLRVHWCSMLVFCPCITGITRRQSISQVLCIDVICVQSHFRSYLRCHIGSIGLQHVLRKDIWNFLSKIVQELGNVLRLLKLKFLHLFSKVELLLLEFLLQLIFFHLHACKLILITLCRLIQLVPDVLALYFLLIGVFLEVVDLILIVLLSLIQLWAQLLFLFFKAYYYLFCLDVEVTALCG